MRGKIIKFSYLARRRQAAGPALYEQKPARKNWLFRLWDKTAAPFWFARLRRRFRHYYRDWAAFRMFAVSELIYRIDVRGIENYSYQPSTIIACGHKRDMDIPIIIPRLYLFQKPVSRRKDFKLMYIAARDDVFERGFLTVYFPWIDFLRPVLAKISLNRLFKILQACPVKLPDEQTVNQLLQETIRLESNLPLEEALDSEWRKRLLGPKAALPGLTLKDALLKSPLKVLSQYATPRMFREPLASRIRQRHAATMVEQLRYITRILDKGGTLIVLPEGRVSPDGRFCKMRAAVTRLVLQTHVETKLLPVNLTYDFLDTARPHVTLQIGPEVINLKQLSKPELTEVIRKNVAGMTCVTFSGLVSRWLVNAAEKGIDTVSIARLREEVWTEAQYLRGLGLPLDSQLDTRQEFEERFERFLLYGRRQPGIFLAAPVFSADSASDAGWLTLDVPALLRKECNKHTDNPVRYCYNELTELLEARGVPVQEKVESEAALTLLSITEPQTSRMTAG
ncbi:MAG TPA: hypothetical protein VH186_28340 [Chloroflexia bacterium]|nr:hypothetical protein [Chloroflexia bacterium]